LVPLQLAVLSLLGSIALQVALDRCPQNWQKQDAFGFLHPALLISAGQKHLAFSFYWQKLTCILPAKARCFWLSPSCLTGLSLKGQSILLFLFAVPLRLQVLFWISQSILLFLLIVRQDPALGSQSILLLAPSPGLLRLWQGQSILLFGFVVGEGPALGSQSKLLRPLLCSFLRFSWGQCLPSVCWQ
jgi:hypothetical protein